MHIHKNKETLILDPQLLLVKLWKTRVQANGEKYTPAHFREKKSLSFWTILNLTSIGDQKVPIESLNNFECDWACPTTPN